MVLDPSREKDAIGADAPVRWYVTDETMFMTALVEELDRGDGYEEGYDNLDDALSYATCTDAPMYVWSEPKGVRQAIAVAIGGELYFQRSGSIAPEEPYSHGETVLRELRAYALAHRAYFSAEAEAEQRRQAKIEAKEALWDVLVASGVMENGEDPYTGIVYINHQPYILSAYLESIELHPVDAIASMAMEGM